MPSLRRKRRGFCFYLGFSVNASCTILCLISYLFWFWKSCLFGTIRSNLDSSFNKHWRRHYFSYRSYLHMLCFVQPRDISSFEKNDNEWKNLFFHYFWVSFCMIQLMCYLCFDINFKSYFVFISKLSDFRSSSFNSLLQKNSIFKLTFSQNDSFWVVSFNVHINRNFFYQREIILISN